MKIEGNVGCGLSVYDLNEGDVFAVYSSFNNNYEVYMKTDSQDGQCVDIDVNAVNLSNGQLCLIESDVKIYLVKGKFVIER